MIRKTMPRLVLAALLFIMANPAAAAEADAFGSLPENIAAHIVIGDLDQAVAQLDDFVAAITEGSANSVPSGVTSMLVGMYLPLPPESWHKDEAVHILIPSTPFSTTQNTVAIIRVDSFDSFIEAMEEEGVDAIEEDADDHPWDRVVTLDLRNLGVIVAMEPAEGLVAIAANADAFAEVLGSPESLWLPPAYTGDADLAAVVSLLSPLGEPLSLNRLQNELERAGGDFPARMGAIGLNPEIGNGFIKLMEKYLPLWDPEIAALRGLQFDLFFNGDELLLTTYAVADAGSWLGKLAAATEKSGNFTSPLAEKAPLGALSLAANADISDLMPDLNAGFRKFTVDFGEMLFPRHREALPAFFDVFTANAVDGNVVVNQAVGNRLYNISYVPVKDGDAAVGAVTKLAEGLEGMLEYGIANPDYRLSIVSDTGEIDGFAYRSFTARFANPDLVAGLIAAAGVDDNPFAVLQDFVLYQGVRNGVLTTVSGQGALPVDFAAAMRNLDTTEKPLLTTENAEAVVKLLENRQLSMALFDADQVYVLMMRALLDNLGGRYLSGRENLYLRALEEAAPGMIASEGFYGIGIGASEGRLGATLAVPAPAVNAAFRNYDKYNMKLLEEAQRRNPDGSLKEEAAPDEGDEGEIEEEEFELDEPAEAS